MHNIKARGTANATICFVLRLRTNFDSEYEHVVRSFEVYVYMCAMSYLGSSTCIDMLFKEWIKVGISC